MSVAGYGAIAQAGGGIIQSVAASLAQKAMEEAFRKQLELQEGYRNQAFGVFQPALQQRGVETARKQIGEGSQNRQGFYQKVGQAPLALKGGQNQRDKANYALQGQVRGQVGGYSDWAINQMINNIRAQDAINKISNFAGGDAQVFPYQLQEAQHSQDELAAFGGMLSGLGGAASSYGNYFQQPQDPYSVNRRPGGAGYSSDFYSMGPQ